MIPAVYWHLIDHAGFMNLQTTDLIKLKLAYISLWAFLGLIDFLQRSTEFSPFPGLWLVESFFFAFPSKPPTGLSSNLTNRIITYHLWAVWFSIRFCWYSAYPGLWFVDRTIADKPLICYKIWSWSAISCEIHGPTESVSQTWGGRPKFCRHWSPRCSQHVTGSTSRLNSPKVLQLSSNFVGQLIVGRLC